jgi:hypothetical protein
VDIPSLPSHTSRSGSPLPPSFSSASNLSNTGSGSGGGGGAGGGGGFLSSRQLHQQQKLAMQHALENSSKGQCYSTNYNKLLNAITRNRAEGNSRRKGYITPGSDWDIAAAGREGDYSPVHRSHASGTGSGTGSGGTGNQSLTASVNAHLGVKHSILAKELQATLNDYPTGEESDTIVTVIAANPHISVIVDQAVKFAAGTELFTIIVGPKVNVRLFVFQRMILCFLVLPAMYLIVLYHLI